MKQSNEISASGCEVEVKIVVDITPSGKESTWQAIQSCTSDDHKFMYILTDCIQWMCVSIDNFTCCRWTVDWGDGIEDIGHQWSIGGYGINHALPYVKPATYRVTANYCSDPDDTAEHRCCDSIFQLIHVS